MWFVLQERRLAAIKELVRLLKTEGQALIYVWAFEQEHNKQRSKYLKAQGKEKQCMTNIISTDSQGLHESSLPLEDKHNNRGNVQCVSKESGMKLTVHTNRTAFKAQDLLVPWHLKDEKRQRGENLVENAEKKKDDDKACSSYALCTSPGSETKRSLPVYRRYYHLFQQGELEQLCGQIPGVRVQSSYHDQGNWCVILEKTA